MYTAPRYANDMHECMLEIKSIINSSYLLLPFLSLLSVIVCRSSTRCQASQLTTHNSSTNSQSQAQCYRQSVTDRPWRRLDAVTRPDPPPQMFLSLAPSSLESHHRLVSALLLSATFRVTRNIFFYSAYTMERMDTLPNDYTLAIMAVH